MTTRFTALAILLIGAAGVQASPVFEFTWTTVPLPYYSGNVYTGQGVTVTGEIFGLPDNGSGPASDVVLDSITGATPVPGSPFASLPLDLLGMEFTTNSVFGQHNQFVVQNDVIMSADFLAVTLDTGISPEYFILGFGAEFLDFQTGGLLNSAPPDTLYMPAEPYSALGYFGTATYSLVTPEPSTAALFFLALAAGAIYRPRVKRG